MTKHSVLIAGGAGFIGSHVTHMLQQAGHQTVVLDNLSRGDERTLLQGPFIQGDIGNAALLDQLFINYPIDTVMHFAAWIDVGESVRHPEKYYINNFGQTLTLLQTMLRHNLKKFVFSSTAAIYGNPQTAKIEETHPCAPINPYGRSKWMVEELLKDLDVAYGLKSCCLRYFNAAGGDPNGLIKNYQTSVTNLIPLIFKSLKTKRPLTIFGTDYPTPDGTCMRDYIHIQDIGQAHLLGMEKLWLEETSCVYNLGNGAGYSVQEVIQTVEKVTGQRVPVQIGARRPGDPAFLIANAQKIQRELGWRPVYPLLETIISHAWSAQNHATD